MGDLGWSSSDTIDYSYDKEAPEFKIVVMESMVFMFLTDTPTDTHDLTKNPNQCIYPETIKPSMDYFLKKANSENDRKWEVSTKAIDGNYWVIAHFSSWQWCFTIMLRELGELSLPLIFCITYTTTEKYYPGEPVNIHIQSLINII